MSSEFLVSDSKVRMPRSQKHDLGIALGQNIFGRKKQFLDRGHQAPFEQDWFVRLAHRLEQGEILQCFWCRFAGRRRMWATRGTWSGVRTSVTTGRPSDRTLPADT